MVQRKAWSHAGPAQGRRRAFAVAPMVVGGKPPQMGEATACSYFRDARSLAIAEQVPPRALKTQFLQERARACPRKRRKCFSTVRGATPQISARSVRRHARSGSASSLSIAFFKPRGSG